MATRPVPMDLPPHAESARQKLLANEFVQLYLQRDLIAIDESIAKARSSEAK